MSYSELSLKLTDRISKKEKKENGIYFTPLTTIHKNIETLTKYMSTVKTILEPSCGSCEYIIELRKKFPSTPFRITGIELNRTIYDEVCGMVENEDNSESNATSLKLINDDFINWKTDDKFDLIIGNPPYYVTSKKQLSREYHKYFDGRPNIYIVFIIRALQLLNENGILSFVLPKSFLNCLYYDKTRKHIVSAFEILHILEGTDDFLETSQGTIILILRNASKSLTVNKSPYVFDIGGYTIIGYPQHISELRSLCSNATTLSDMGFTVSVGNVVWNQCKPLLTDDTTKTLLIYSSDIKNNKLTIQTYSNKDKKNYIKKTGSKEPVLVVNRGYGMGNYKLQYCLIDEDDQEYLIENHLICIKITPHTYIDRENAIGRYNQIIRSFENEKTHKFIRLYFANNAINTTELHKIVPIFTNA
jgi:type I restriction-modification system DNA methylase subunit